MDRDARSLPPDAQAELRRRAVRLVGQGRSISEVAGLVGVARETVGHGVARHQAGGPAALDRRGGHTKLTDAQQQMVAALIVSNNPDQLSLPGFLWTRELVAELIMQRLGVRVAPTPPGAICAPGDEPAGADASRL